MSKAPGAASDYDGSGGWFKIKDWGEDGQHTHLAFFASKLTSHRPDFQRRRHGHLGHGRYVYFSPHDPPRLINRACLTPSGSYTYNIPTCIPDGDYLLRIQSLAIHNPWPAGIPQFYISCAQITVTGGGNGNPGPTALIPGAFKDTDPGYTVNVSARARPAGAPPHASLFASALLLTQPRTRSTRTSTTTRFPARRSSAATAAARTRPRR
jgi:hypothetical protein